MALAAKILSVLALTEISHLGVVVRIGDRDLCAGIGKVFEQVFHVRHGGLRRQALNNMMGRLSNNWPIVPAALGLSRKCSCGLSEGLSRYPFGCSEGRCQVARVYRTPIWITVGSRLAIARRGIVFQISGWPGAFQQLLA